MDVPEHHQAGPWEVLTGLAIAVFLTVGAGYVALTLVGLL